MQCGVQSSVAERPRQLFTARWFLGVRMVSSSRLVVGASGYNAVAGGDPPLGLYEPGDRRISGGRPWPFQRPVSSKWSLELSHLWYAGNMVDRSCQNLIVETCSERLPPNVARKIQIKKISTTDKWRLRRLNNWLKWKHFIVILNGEKTIKFSSHIVLRVETCPERLSPANSWQLLPHKYRLKINFNDS